MPSRKFLVILLLEIVELTDGSTDMPYTLLSSTLPVMTELGADPKARADPLLVERVLPETTVLAEDCTERAGAPEQLRPVSSNATLLALTVDESEELIAMPLLP